MWKQVHGQLFLKYKSVPLILTELNSTYPYFSITSNFKVLVNFCNLILLKLYTIPEISFFTKLLLKNWVYGGMMNFGILIFFYPFFFFFFFLVSVLVWFFKKNQSCVSRGCKWNIALAVMCCLMVGNFIFCKQGISYEENIHLVD